MFGVVLKRGNNVTIYLSFRDVGNCKGLDNKSKMILLYNNILDVGCDVWGFFLTFYVFYFVPKTQMSVLLNTKYMKIMMQIKHNQRLKRHNLVWVLMSVCVCDDDH